MENISGLVKKAINEEELLQLALCVSTKYFQDPEHPMRQISDRICVAYIIQESGDPDFPNDEITERYAELLTQYVLNEGVSAGDIDVLFDDDGEIRYKLSDIEEELNEDNPN
jgi:hypothetical protein